MAVRGTQSFVHVLSECWSRPSLLALEILWRWLFGVPLLLLLGWIGLHTYMAISNQLAATGIDQFSIVDPMRAAEIASDVYAVVAPPIFHIALWLAPLALLAWAVVSGVGRNAVLRRYDRSLPQRGVTLGALQLLRVVFLGGSFWFWFAAIQWAANFSLSGEEPNLVALLRDSYMSFSGNLHAVGAGKLGLLDSTPVGASGKPWYRIEFGSQPSPRSIDGKVG